jgi:hypothetical protein
MNGQPAPSIGWLDFGTPRDFLSPQFARSPMFCFASLPDLPQSPCYISTSPSSILISRAF